MRLSFSIGNAGAAAVGMLMLLPVGGSAESFVDESFGGMLGVSCSFGTARTRLGVIARGYYADSHFQANAEAGIHYDFVSFGPAASGLEIRTSLGGVLTWGDADDTDNVFLSPVSNQTGRRNSFGYAWNRYWDRIGTSQRTGTVALQINTFHLATENDVLAGKGEDRFRTGAISAAFRNGDSMLAARTLLWTGDTEGAPKVRDTSYPSKFGYKDMSQARYGNRSHGIFAVQFRHAWSGLQTVGLELGVDSERVRHVVQNRFIHDLAFLPDGWIDSENPHVPMLDADGGQYLFLEGQSVEPAEAYFQLEANSSLFY